MTKVVFNRLDEFLAEVAREHVNIERSILRATYVVESGGDLPLRRISVVAGVIVDGRVIELKEFCGHLFEGDETPTPARALMKRIEAWAADAKLDLRAGRFEA